MKNVRHAAVDGDEVLLLTHSLEVVLAMAALRAAPIVADDVEPASAGAITERCAA